MKNSIRKRKYKHKITIKNDFLLYNIASVGIIVEVLIGAVLAIALCFGFVASFIVFKGNLLLSLGIFFTSLIAALLLVLLFKYIFISIMVKMQSIEILEKMLKRF